MIDLMLGDCRQELKKLASDSVDSIVTDPPYEIGFMGKSWDSTGIAYDVGMWAECLRVLKPGGHLLSFGGSRTYHRMASAIEDAGFQIRDQIMWVYGSGFPKSLDVSKAIDKAGGRAENWFGPWLRKERERIGMTSTKLAALGGFYKNVNHGGLVVNWELGYGLPSATEFNKVCELLNAPFERIEELEREVVGHRKVNKGLAFTSEGAEFLDVTLPATESAKTWDGWGTALKPAHEPIVVARKPLIGTVVSNVLTHGTGALNIGGCRVGTEQVPSNKLEQWSGFGEVKKPDYTQTMNTGRWPANLIHDGSDEVEAEFAKYGDRKSCMTPSKADCEGAIFGGKRTQGNLPMDSGTASRFFYCAKANKKDREQGNDHATVKPTELMRYLCRLVTPPNGIVLDPFMGSGSTGKAAMLEGFRFVGIEENQHHFEIAQTRLGRNDAVQQSFEMSLDEVFA